MQDTSIEWAELTWNPTRGCSRISPGCQHCYAEQIAARFSGAVETEIGLCKPGIFSGFAEFRIIGGKTEAHWTGKVELVEDKLLEPLKRRKWALRFFAKHGRKPRCFVNSMSDLFHENLDSILIDRVFAVMALCPEIDFLCLTKRASRLPEYVNESASIRVNRQIELWMEFMNDFPRGIAFSRRLEAWPLPNCWLGVSVEDRARKNRIDHLRRTPAAIRFLSIEPLLEDIGWLDLEGIHWVVVGGESGPGARPFDLDWARSIRDQCKAAGTKYFLKQVGSRPMEHFEADLEIDTYDATLKLRDKKGGDMREWPADLQNLRELPR